MCADHGRGGELIEGRHAVLELLLAGAPVQRVLIAEGVRADASIDRIVEAARAEAVPIERVARAELDAQSERGAHQGVAAVSAGFRYTSLSALIASLDGRRDCAVVVLDHVTDPHNLGAIARSVDAAGGDGIIIAAQRAASVTAAAFKSSAGALAHVPVVREVNIAQTIVKLQEAGLWVAGADQGAGQTLWDAPLDGLLAFVVGSEGEGLSRLVRERCDFLVSIPQAGSVSSLNVAQAATLLLYERLRRVRSGDPA